MAIVTAVAVFCAIAPVSWTLPALDASLWLIVLGSAATALRRLGGIAGNLRR